MEWGVHDDGVEWALMGDGLGDVCPVVFNVGFLVWVGLC